MSGGVISKNPCLSRNSLAYLNTYERAFMAIIILWLLSHRCLTSSRNSGLWYSVIGNC